MRKFIYVVVMLVGLSGASFADGAAASGAAANAVSSSASAGGLSIPSGTSLTAKFLDDCWAQRENLANQKIIADYLLTYPTVPQDYATAWKTARLVCFIGNFGYGEKKFATTSLGSKLFDYGVNAAKIAVAQQSGAIEGQYWYAVDLASYMVAKGLLSAGSRTKEWMSALTQANSINQNYQWYGTSRMLGSYYQTLPKLFGGSDKKALQYFTNATTNAPTYRNNWIFLGRYYLSQGDYKDALTNCQKALTMAPQDGKYEEMRMTKDAKECVAIAQAKQ